MKISYNWLKDFVEFSHSPDELALLFNQAGLAVDGLDETTGRWTRVVVGRVLTCEAVPKSDHLSHCQVDAGTGETLSIVCGAPNVAEGQTVAVAVVGAELPGGFKIEQRKLRGVLSQGMICSEKELGLSDVGSGILVLPDDCRIGAPLEDYLGRQDWVYDLEVTLNRPDWLSHLGVAREIAAATGLSLTMPDASLMEIETGAADMLSIEILDPDKCPRYSARIVNGVTVAPSPLWMQERLRVVGVRSINNVVDITNYVMMELGHPLHAFDYHLVNDGKIIVRTAKKGEPFKTLDEKQHKLTDSDLLIADPEGGIALAGVMGGFNSEIKDDTSDVLIECAYFEPVGIRITSRDRSISTESSHRFERGVDPEATPYVSARVAKLIHDLAGGEVLKGVVDNYPKPWKSTELTLRPQRVNRLLATEIPRSSMIDYLFALGCGVESDNNEKGQDAIRVTTPSWRHDLEREIDLVEEVARLHGYGNIDEAIRSGVPLSIDPEHERERLLTDRIKHALVELNLFEAITPTLVPASDWDKLPDQTEPVKLLNRLSEDMAQLRSSLAPSLMREVERNINAGVADIRLYEWGKCFGLNQGKIAEEWRLAGVITGSVRPESWGNLTRGFNVHDLKGLLQALFRKLSLDSVQYIYYDVPAFLSVGGSLSLELDGKPIKLGLFGQIDPKVAERFAIEQILWYFEITGDQLLFHAGSIPRYRTLPRYPAARRDLAFLVDRKVRSAEIEQVLAHHGSELLESVELFDLYEGESLPEGRKSMAYHLRFRSAERTLSDAEIDDIIERVVRRAESDVGAKLRSI